MLTLWSMLSHCTSGQNKTGVTIGLNRFQILSVFVNWSLLFWWIEGGEQGQVPSRLCEAKGLDLRQSCCCCWKSILSSCKCLCPWLKWEQLFSLKFLNVAFLFITSYSNYPMTSFSWQMRWHNWSLPSVHFCFLSNQGKTEPSQKEKKPRPERKPFARKPCFCVNASARPLPCKHSLWDLFNTIVQLVSCSPKLSSTSST